MSNTPPTPPETVRLTVKQWRELRGLRAVDLASKTGAGLSTILNIESGRQEPRAGLAQRIADVLGVTFDMIAWGKLTPEPPPPTRRPKADKADKTTQAEDA